MSHCLTVLSFAAALLLSSAAAPAQVPTGKTGSTLVVTDFYVFALHDGVLFQFEKHGMKLLARVDLASLARGEADPPLPEVTMEPEVEVVEEPVAGFDDFGKKADAVENAVDAALEWLVRHQDEDGRWDADEFMKHDVRGEPCDGAGSPVKDVGVTALATLALMGGGSNMRAGEHKEQVRAAAAWLRDQQQANGLIGTNATHDFIYGHSIATLALAEAYGLSRHKALKPAVQKAVNYLEMHRNPYAVWRYQPRDNDNDTSVTTWALMAYCSAQSWGLDVNENALNIVASWYDQVTDDNGRTGYSRRGERSSRQPGDHAVRFPPENGEALTAAALFGRFLLDQDPKTKPIMNESAALLAAKPPRWAEGHIDPYYWWFGTQAMFQMGGRHWRAWRRGLENVVAAQRRDGNAAGSWDPIGVWDMDGGRVYSTAMYALTLETIRRNARLKR